MAEPLNVTHAVRFELGRGRISLDGTEPRVLIPADALRQLCAAASAEGVKDFGRRIGTEIGRRVAKRIGDKASVAVMVEHMGGDMALAGMGSLGLEVWGRAMVFTVTDAPLEGDGDALVAAVLEGAIQRSLGRDAAVVPLSRSDGKVRLAVVSPKTAPSLREWLASGVTWGDALTRLNGTT